MWQILGWVQFCMKFEQDCEIPSATFMYSTGDPTLALDPSVMSIYRSKLPCMALDNSLTSVYPTYYPSQWCQSLLYLLYLLLRRQAQAKTPLFSSRGDGASSIFSFFGLCNFLSAVCQPAFSVRPSVRPPLACTNSLCARDIITNS
jgi:hypothetical protein